jgi:hypothetical protein
LDFWILDLRFDFVYFYKKAVIHLAVFFIASHNAHAGPIKNTAH